MRLTLLVVLAAFVVAACDHVPIGKIHDRRMDPGAPRPNFSESR